MQDQEIIIEVARLDNKEVRYNKDALVWEILKNGHWYLWQEWYNEPDVDYTESRDAIIPVIRKVLTTSELKVKFLNALRSLVEARLKRATSDFDLLVESTERELCIALLKATGKWKEKR